MKRITGFSVFVILRTTYRGYSEIQGWRDIQWVERKMPEEESDAEQIIVRHSNQSSGITMSRWMDIGQKVTR